MATQVINGTAGDDVLAAHTDAAYLAGRLVLTLGGMPSQGGWPAINVWVNGAPLAINYVITTEIRTGQTQTLTLALPAGAIDTVQVQYVNDLVTTVDDRNVYIADVKLNGISLPVEAAVYTRDDYPTITGQHDMNWNGVMTWSGALVQNAGAAGGHADNVAIDAGGGQDVVTYVGRLADYDVSYTGAASLAVTPKSGVFATDTVQNAENVLFDDRIPYGFPGQASVDPVNHTIDGGTGLDTLVLQGAHTQYTISHTTTGFSINGNGVNEWVTNVERLKFTDGYVALDLSLDGGMAYRLYQAAFDRVPDIPGLGYQINAMDTGLTLIQVAGNFLASPEFQRTYGALDDTQFVTQLYRNVLDREPDADGLAFHLNDLHANGKTRAMILANFSESPENQANVIGSIQDGMFYTL